MFPSNNRKLVEQYVQLDPNMSPQDIVVKIMKDHSVEIDNRQVSGIRLRYLRSVGLISQQKGQSGIAIKVEVLKKDVSTVTETIAKTPGANGQVTKPSQTTQQTPGEILLEFLRVVNKVGGKKAAQEILAVLEAEKILSELRVGV